MTDINGKVAEVGDRVALAFEWCSRGVLRVGTIEAFGEDRYGSRRATIRWSAASEGGLPQSPVTTVMLRNYIILD